MTLDKKLRMAVDGANEFLTEEMPKRRKECEKNGKHKKIFWLPVRQGAYRVEGVCKYCLTYDLKRNLTDAEQSLQEHYNDMLYEPFTL